MTNYLLKVIKTGFLRILFLAAIFGNLPNFGWGQVVINQVDDFNDGTVQGWVTGKLNDTIITNQANKLQVRAIGGTGQFGKLLVFNETTWSGDYIGQGITSIKLKLQNIFDPFGNGLKMRLAIGDGRAPGASPNGTTWFVSTTPVILTTSSGEVEAMFSIKEADLTRAQGAATYTSVLSNVAALRITNATSATNPRGDDITIATLLIDDITACGCLGTPYNETVDGDLSSDFSKPTFIELSGTTMDTITSCQQGSPLDVDYFTIEVPQDSVLSGLVLTNYTAAENNKGFFGVRAGTAFTTSAGNTTAGDLLGGVTYGSEHEGLNILPVMGTLSGSQGFTGALPAGKYTFWLNQFGPQSCASLQFLLSKAPENNDLSNDALNPTTVQFSPAMDTVSNCFQNGEVDYFTFNVPIDSVLTGIKLTGYEVASASNQAFIGIQKGNTFTEPASGTNVANLLGGLVFGTGNLGTDILPAMGNLPSSQGFTAPLSAGDYTIWLNQTGDESCATFQFQFANNDLSDDRLNPTVVSFSENLDTVSNCVQGNPSDVDYFTFNVPVNSELSELKLKNYEFEGTNNQSFIGIQAGTTFTEPASGTDVGNLLGGLVFGAGNLGTDILPAMGTLNGSQGFTTPLPAGDYTLWLNQTGPSACATFQFVFTTNNECPSILTFANETVNSDIYKAADTIKTIGNVLIENASTVTFQAGKAIQLNSGFHVMAGSNFSAQIIDCTPPANLSRIENDNRQQFFTQPKRTQIPLKVYPNPFYNATTIAYKLNKAEKVGVYIYNLSGKLVKTIIEDEFQAVGNYQYDFRKDNLKEGMYFLNLRTEKEQLVKKIVLLD